MFAPWSNVPGRTSGTIAPQWQLSGGAPPKIDYLGSRCKNWPVSTQWQTPCHLPDRCRGDRWYVLVQVFITVHNLGWVLEESCVPSYVYPQGTKAFGPAVPNRLNRVLLAHCGIWVVLNPVESCIISPLWHSENPSVGLKVLLLTLMLPQHTEKINKSDRHKPWKNQ